MTARAGVFVLCCAAVAWALPAAGQGAAPAASHGTRLDSTVEASLIREIVQARERNLPVEPLEAKVREGRAKHATVARIHGAVLALAARLDSARTALGMISTTEELVAGADALQVGATLPSLRALRTAGARNLAIPLGTLAQLVASGVAQARAAELIVELVRRNAPDMQILALGNLVDLDVSHGVRAYESAVLHLRRIEDALSGSSTAAPPVGTPQRKP